MTSVNKNFKVKNGIDVLNGAVVIPNPPTDATHAANKEYVDTIAETIGVGPTGPAGTYDVAPTPPANPDEGDIWYDETVGATYLYYDSYWVEIAGAQGPTGPTGATGAGVNILGNYPTEEDLIAAQPTANPGDAYLVAGDLYVWDDINNQWDNVGNIQGPAGAVGVTGPVTLAGTSTNATIGINSSSANTANFVVQRDGSGNFAANEVTATLIGNYSIYQTTGGSVNSRKKIYVADPSISAIGTNGAGLVNPALGDLWFW